MRSQLYSKPTRCLLLCRSHTAAACCRCGDLYGDKAIDTFNACAVSDQKCVPQRQDEGLYPIPPDCALDEGFDLNGFQGRWYITAGQNPLFDIFDCQVRLPCMVMFVVYALEVCVGCFRGLCLSLRRPPHSRWGAQWLCGCWCFGGRGL
jgi:hypothetical protein